MTVPPNNPDPTPEPDRWAQIVRMVLGHRHPQVWAFCYVVAFLAFVVVETSLVVDHLAELGSVLGPITWRTGGGGGLRRRKGE